jgi:ferredoxin
VSCGACADTCPTDAITEITLLDGVVPDRPPRQRERGGRKRRPLASE